MDETTKQIQEYFALAQTKLRMFSGFSGKRGRALCPDVLRERIPWETFEKIFRRSRVGYYRHRNLLKHRIAIILVLHGYIVNIDY